MSIFFYNLDFFKKHIKITDVKIKQKQSSSPHFPENQTVFTRQKRRKPQCHFPQNYLFCVFTGPEI